jgi:steroid delta-isomerase-like uncharacterized protein
MDLHQIARDFFEEIWNQKIEASIDKFIAEGAAGNDPKFGVGRESFREQWKKWLIAFPDINFEVKEIIAENNSVVSRWTLTGTNNGEFRGKPATGKRVSVDGVSIDRIENGQVASGFDAWDELGLISQLYGEPKY